jgi:hypothetical protein
VVDGVLSQPFLYLSLYFREHRAEYYDALRRLESLGIAKEISGRRRDRVYAYGKQLEILDRGTDVHQSPPFAPWCRHSDPLGDAPGSYLLPLMSRSSRSVLPFEERLGKLGPEERC